MRDERAERDHGGRAAGDRRALRGGGCLRLGALDREGEIGLCIATPIARRRRGRVTGVAGRRGRIDASSTEGLRTVVPQGRVGVADDVADAALYLASDQSAYVNGIALTVDGGWLAEKSFAAGEAAGRTFLAANETRDDV